MIYRPTSSIMKSIFVLCFVVFTQVLCFGQDTIVFKNGNVLPVKIVDASNLHKTIKYDNNGKISIVSFHQIDRYKTAGSWVVLDTNTTTTYYPIEPTKKHKKIDTKPSTGWSIGTNLTSLIFGINTSDRINLTASIRPLFTIEPEFRFKNSNFSLRTTFDFGIPYRKVDGEPLNKTDSMASYNQVIQYNWGTDEANNLVVLGVDQNRRYKDRYIPFQAGMSIKFWPPLKLQNRLFFQIGFIAGIADFHAITVYDRYVTYTEPWYINTRLIEQKFFIEKDPYFFMLPELGIGYVFHLTKSIKISTDLTYLKNPKNKGSKKDIVYMSLDNSTYTKVYEQRYNPTYEAPSLHFRVKFLYQFNKNTRGKSTNAI